MTRMGKPEFEEFGESDKDREERLALAKAARLKALRKEMKNINKYPHKCLRCGNKWSGRFENPKVCPSCSSPYWKTKPTRSNAKESTKSNPHTTATLKVGWVYGLKKAASQATNPQDRTVSAYIVKILGDAGIRPLTFEEYEEWKAKRKSQGKFFLD